MVVSAEAAASRTAKSDDSNVRSITAMCDLILS